MDELSREELIARLDEMAREINELKAEIARLKLPPTTSKNSPQPPSCDLTKFNWHEAQKELPKVYEKLLADLH